MGRFEKKLIDTNGVDRRESGYYSTPDFIAKYITEELLRISPNGTSVLDPAVGKEELLEYFFRAGKEIDSFDIIEYDDYNYSNFSKTDFIEFYKSRKKNQFFNSDIDLQYDYYITNPPYNCHEINYIRDNKKELNSLFGEVGVHNMYSMFLASLIDLAKDGAMIGAIISDSFLTATMHSGLRQLILNKCTIHQLLLCPNDLFWSQQADVRTCIIILQKGRNYQGKITTSNRARDTNEFKLILYNRRFQETSIENLLLGKSKNDNQFIIDIEPEIINLFHNKRLGGLYKCITGISTGEDAKYLSKDRKEGYSIPFYKNPGKRKFKTEPDAFLIDHFLEESLKVKDFMVRNKEYLFKEGITCSSMGVTFGACYLPKGSTYGVNANIFPPLEDIHWLISYLNSSLVTFFVRGIIIRSNMVTSGYISQIPIPVLESSVKESLGDICKDVLSNNISVNEAISKIDEILFQNLHLSSAIQNKIKSFAKDLNRKV